MSRFEIWYADPLGTKLKLINKISSFSYTKVVGDVGVLQIDTPLGGELWEANNPDYRVLVYRQPYGGALKLEIVAFLDLFNFSTDQRGLGGFSLGGSDPNVLLARKIVAYDSEDTKATFTGSFSSNQLREIFRVNLGNGAVAGRDLSSYIDLAGNIGKGPSISKQAAWKNVLGLLQDVQAYAKQGGSEVFFGIVPTSETGLEFKMYASQPGADRTQTTGKAPVVFSLERGNLLDPVLTYDYTNEANYIYAGGKGQGADRNIQESENTTATGRSPFARKEKFVSAISGVLDNSDDEISAKANDALAKNRARVNLAATIVSTPSQEYGKDWDFGDRVTIDYQNIQFDTIIRAVTVSMAPNGKETIRARVELDD